MKTFDLKEINLTKFLLFTGKGGVGKTSTACATAIALADQGKSVLLVSTDPASNLQDVFETALTNKPKQIASVTNLCVANLDPEEAAKEYKEKIVGPYRNSFPEAVVNQIEEQLSGACTVEIAAFDEFTNLLIDENVINSFDHIIFDTAPTGHTLRLLQLPTAWSGFLDESTHGASCLGPLAGLNDKKVAYQSTVNVLSDSAQTTIVLVSRPDTASLQEASRASNELKALGITNQQLVVNGVLANVTNGDEVSLAFHARQQVAIQSIPSELIELPKFIVPLMPFNVTGLVNLRKLFKPVTGSSNVEATEEKIELNELDSLVNDVLNRGQRVIFTMGKGGVGKTTVASAIAVALADKGKKVHLTTTDPAAHVKQVLHDSADYPNITVSNIDPKIEIEAYKNEIIKSSSESLDEEGLAYLEEDLRSPCTEEIAVFRKFAEVIEQTADDEIIVIDTAPTGHTLLLLDATQTYNNEILRSQGEVPVSIQNLLPRLRNPQETSVVIVTLAEVTPVFEATRLKEDLIRAGIHPKWWVVNQSFYATKTSDVILKGRGSSEGKWIKEVMKQSENSHVVIPWTEKEVKGYKELLKLSK